jgi:hypothetical protein
MEGGEGEYQSIVSNTIIPQSEAFRGELTIESEFCTFA